HRDLVAELLLELVDRRRRIATELDCGAIRANGVDLHGLLRGINADEAVQVRQALVIVIRIALAGDRLADLVLVEDERTGTEDVLLEPMRVLLEDLLGVDPG